MVFTSSDLPHLKLMDKLAEKQPNKVKTNSTKTALPTPTFEERLFKLCFKLREAGFEQYATAIENKYVIVKRADVHLYKVFEEDGDALVEFAHPKGDHNVSDGELGDVETIVSQHKKIHDVLDKMPTGKLAGYVEMCKMILLADSSDRIGTITVDNQTVSDLEQQIKNNMSNLVDIMKRIKNVADKELTFESDADYKINLVIDHAAHPTLDNLDTNQFPSISIKNALDAIEERLRPGWSGGLSQDSWDSLVSPLIEEAKSLTDKSIELRKQVNTQIAEKTTQEYQNKPQTSEPNQAPQNDVKSGLLMTLKSLKDKYYLLMNDNKIPGNIKPAYDKWFSQEELDIQSSKTETEYNERYEELNDMKNRLGV